MLHVVTNSSALPMVVKAGEYWVYGSILNIYNENFHKVPIDPENYVFFLDTFEKVSKLENDMPVAYVITNQPRRWPSRQIGINFTVLFQIFTKANFL